MGYPTIGLEGIVTSWSGTANALILTALDEHKVSVSIDGGVSSRTGFASGLTTETHGVGLRSWSGTISGRKKLGTNPPAGYLGLVTFASGYATHVRNWSMDISAAEINIDTFNSTATLAGWRSWRPGILNWRGQYEAFVDSATALTLPVVPNTAAASATFKMGEASSVAQTLAGTIHASSLDVDIGVGDSNTARFAFQGSGDLTAAGSSNLFAAAAVGLPAWDESGSDGVCDTTLVFQAASSRTYTGAAFWTGISIRVAPAEYIEIDVRFRGSGALTLA